MKEKKVDLRAKCEAFYWLGRFRTIAKAKGHLAARAWWAETIEKIEKTRGKEGANALTDDMNRLKNEARGEN